jgi:hypothetical protein
VSHSAEGKGEGMAEFSAQKNDRLLQALNHHERELNRWLNSAPANPIFFLEDPVAALRAANIGISENLLRELEETMNGLLEKLRPTQNRKTPTRP